jgi:hypothetical protein
MKGEGLMRRKEVGIKFRKLDKSEKRGLTK